LIRPTKPATTRCCAISGRRHSRPIARLSEIFAKQRNDNIDLSGVAVDPQLTLLPQIEASGLLHMTGFFPSVPTQVNFDLAYAVVNGQVAPVRDLGSARPH